MKRVIIESPYAGKDEEQRLANIAYAHLCMVDSLKRGEAPLASHLLYTQVLDDNVPEERHMGISAGLAWLTVAEAHVFYIDLGYSPGMEKARDAALAFDMIIEERKILNS